MKMSTVAAEAAVVAAIVAAVVIDVVLCSYLVILSLSVLFLVHFALDSPT